jgi:receptor protein-tyrosine kinase
MSPARERLRPKIVERWEPSTESGQPLSQVLMRQSGLTEDDLTRINAVQDQIGLGFVEAAMRLGLITQADLDAVLGGEARDVMQPRFATAKPSGEIMSAQDPGDPFSEQVRMLRTELLLRAEAETCNVFVVMSPAAAEGRSRIAAELAVAFSQIGQPTLLVDADLREPRQHELFGAANEHGLAQALVDGRAPPISAVAGLPSLSILTAGPRPQNPSELLAESTFAELLKGWRRRHRHIVIDTPPVSEFADGLSVATCVGRVLLVGRKHHTSMDEARTMLQRLEATQARVIGSVLCAF